jgi:PKD domain-containing protein
MSHKFSQCVASLFLALAIAIAGVTPALAAAPANDDFGSATVIGSLPFSDSVDNTEATEEPGEPNSCSSRRQSVWYKFMATSNAVIRADMDGSSFSDTSFTVYQAIGPGIGDLSFRECTNFGGFVTFGVQAGSTYYIQAGNIFNGSGGDLYLNLQEIPPPSNNNFANATLISDLPFDDSVETLGATLEADEPIPSCDDFGETDRTVWYSFTPGTSGTISARFNFINFNPIVAAYTGNQLANLTEVGCRTFGNTLTFHADANTTYYFQVGGIFGEGGSVGFRLEVTPAIAADFFFNPSNPSIFDNVEFCDNSSDPGGVGFQSMTWGFGDGITSTDNCAVHRYLADGDYTVQHSVTTFDGRSASTSQVVHVRTHDVSISNVSAPKSANVGQTKAITVSIRNTRYPETVRIELYRSVAGGSFELISTSTQFIPVRSGNRTTQFSFNYTFRPQDAQVGKVTFRAIVVIENANDAFQADNEAISTPPTAVKR